jgi:hypothetical protein
MRRLGMGYGLSVRGKRSGSSNWTPPLLSTPTVLTTTDTTQTISTTIIGVGFDGLSWEYSLDGMTNWIVKGTSLTGSYSATGLNPNTLYYWRVRAYKGSTYSSYTSVTSSTTLEKWYLQGGISTANVVAAYTPIKKTTLAESYINDANPGTYDATPIVAPSLVTSKGWQFSTVAGSMLNTHIIPTNNQTWSMVIKYRDFVKTTNEQALAGTYAASQKIFMLVLGKSSNPNMIFANGSSKAVSTSPSEAVMAVAGNKGYISSIEVATNISVGSGNISYEILIGAVNGATPGWFANCIIESVAIYNKILTLDELKGLQYRMINLIKTNDQLIQRIRYNNWGFGLGICFSISTFTGGVNYVNGDVNMFNPTDLDVEEWLDTAVISGAKYIDTVAKDEAGFCLYPTAFADPTYSPYSIGSTNWYANNGNYDILSHVINGCRSRNLGIVLYFSIRDLTHEVRSGTDEVSDPTTYINMIKTQLTEILSNYGAIDAIWFDDWNWHVSYGNIPFFTIYDHVKSLQPNCLVLTNEHLFPTNYSDIEIWESETADGHVPAGNTRLAEEVETMRTDGKWIFNLGDDNTSAVMKDKATINTQIAQSNSRAACYNLQFQVDRTGHIVASQKTILESLRT